MADYTKITDFAVKDSLLTGNPLKLITGTAHDNEYNAIAVAIATKVDESGGTLTNGALVNPVLGTPASGTLTNCTGLPASTGISGFGAEVSSATHSATNKTTPIDADEIPLADSAATFGLKHVTWANIKATLKTYFDTIYAALAGSATQTFSVAAATAAAHAARLDQISLMPTVVSATSPDIFGAVGATINYNNSTPITATSFAACTSAQIGSHKTIIPTADANFTASANLIIDGATSGTYMMPTGALVDVIPLTTTQFKVTTIYATGTWTPNQGAGLTVVGAFSSTGIYTKIGRLVSVQFKVMGATSVAVSAVGVISSNAPFSASVTSYGSGTNDAATTSSTMFVNLTNVASVSAIPANASISGSIEYQI